MITDPTVGTGWFDGASGYEIGDVCAGVIYGVNWGGNSYVAQAEWSAELAGCVTGGIEQLVIDTTSGVPGTTITLTGTGFGISEPVNLSFTDALGTATSLGTVISDAVGAFATPVDIPAAAAGGRGTLDATGSRPDDGAAADFVVSYFRPDVQIGSTKHGPSIGNNLYNITGKGQTLSQKVPPGGALTYFVKLQNDGNVTDTYSVKGSAAPTGFTVTYETAGTRVTRRVKLGTYVTAPLAPGASMVIKLVVKVRSKTGLGAHFKLKLLATSILAGTSQDAVVGNTKVK